MNQSCFENEEVSGILHSTEMKLWLGVLFKYIVVVKGQLEQT